MQSSESYSDQLLQSYKDLYEKEPSQCKKNLHNELYNSFKILLIEDQIKKFNPLYINNEFVLEDISVLGPVNNLNFENDSIDIEIEWTIIFNRSKYFNTKPVFKIKYQEDKTAVNVILKSIKYPEIDETY